MPLPIRFLLSIVISYLIGSIPTAYLFGRIFKKIDIRKFGSGNVGATNAFRVLGKGPGVGVLIIDILKGILATTVVVELFGLDDNVIFSVILGLVAVVGHNWTCFLNFKGGKGIATSLGVLIGLTMELPSIRPVLLIAVGVWAVFFLITGFVSLASIMAAIVLPLAMVLTNQPLCITTLGIVFCVFVILRHRPNIQRLLSGKESRVKMPFHKSQ